MSYSALSRLTGIGRGTVWKHCTGKAEPDTRSLRRYSQVGIPVSSFILSPTPATGAGADAGACAEGEASDAVRELVAANG